MARRKIDRIIDKLIITRDLSTTTFQRNHSNKLLLTLEF